VLGLGAPYDPPELAAGGSSAARWRVRTARGPAAGRPELPRFLERPDPL